MIGIYFSLGTLNSFIYNISVRARRFLGFYVLNPNLDCIILYSKLPILCVKS